MLKELREAEERVKGGLPLHVSKYHPDRIEYVNHREAAMTIAETGLMIGADDLSAYLALAANALPKLLELEASK